MKDRLIQLLDLEQMTPSKFADTIGVQRSSVSHVLSGRNKPSFDFLQKTLKAFPGLNAEWLMLGKGKMYEHTVQSETGTLFDSQDDTALRPAETEERPEDAGKQLFEERFEEEEPQQERKSGDTAKKVVKVMIFYEDDTFKSFEPSL